MAVLAVDPGPVQSGWCVFGYLFDGKPYVADSGVWENEMLLRWLVDSGHDILAIEAIASYGMPVGKEVFDTCIFVGRFQQSWRDPNAVRLIYRRDVKLHLCGNARAKDSNIRQALIDKLGPAGTLRAKGPLYGVKSHAWAALAVAVTALETKG